MSGDYRGEGLGYYFTRLQAQREQERKRRQEQGTVDSATQIDPVDTENTHSGGTGSTDR